MENLFGKMTRTFLRRIRVKSKNELKERILLGIAEINAMQVVHFFFQAEDGIRAATVTGVQTCALPISRPSPSSVRPGAARGTRAGDGTSPDGATRAPDGRTAGTSPCAWRRDAAESDPVSDVTEPASPAPTPVPETAGRDDPHLDRHVRVLDGQDAVELLEAGLEPDVILLDLSLPRMSGRAFLEWMRAQPKHEHRRVIVASAYLDELPPVEADRSFQKPFRPERLAAELERLTSGE